MAIFYTKIFDLFGLCETLDILVQFLNIFCESLCTQVVLWDKSAYMCVYYTIQWILIVFTSQAIQLRKYGFRSKEIIELDRGVSNFFWRNQKSSNNPMDIVNLSRNARSS